MNRQPRKFVRQTLAAAVVMALAGAAQGQISTATVKGQIAGTAANTAVVAVNKANGATYRTTTLPDGSYVLSGLAPGDYQIRIGSGQPQDLSLSVGETATLDLNAAAGAGGGGASQQIVITGTAQRKDVRNSEVGTTVSRRLIETLPQSTRNFLSSADLAPGVVFGSDASGNTSIQGGAQDYNHVNVFIDGVGQKNNILKGGLTGQDSSRGNPFPQSAIAEYRVLTQNYKAEYDQVSSVAVTAITKSGTNKLSGDVYIDRTGTNWRAKSEFEREREAQGVLRPASEKKEYGFSIGGPIVRDQVHFFFAYDGKDIDDSRQVVPRNLNLLPANLGLAQTLRSYQGSQVDPFREHLLFGKVDAQLGDNNRLSASFRVRREDDRTPESRDLSAPGNDVERSNDETRVDLKWEWSSERWLSEARIGVEEYQWNPHSASNSPFIKYKVSTANPQTLAGGAQDVLFVGGSPNAQDRAQKGVTLSEDLTYTGLARHVIKGGVKVKAMKYDLSGTAFSVPTVETLIDIVSGQSYFNGSTCTGTNISNNGLQSDQCRIFSAIPGSAVEFNNTQIGVYIQDDWAITPRLELNVGVRYDYETNMLNDSYVTPAERVAALRGPDNRTIGGPNGPIVAPAGQTYAQSLARGGINIDDYISTGSSRQKFKGAIAPRVGFSFDLTGDRNSVLFGGYGRSYSRTVANNALDELQKNSQPGGEIWLMRNDFKMPYADQFSLGLRQGLGAWNAEVAISRVEAKNQWVWFLGNRDPNGGFGNQSPIDPLWGGPNGFGSLILGDSVGQSRTDSLFIKLEKPYTRASGWTANLAYTYADAKTTHREWNNDIFDFTYGRSGHRGFNPSTLVARHRAVLAGMADTLLPWGLTVAGKFTYDTGMPRRIVNCSGGFTSCVATRGEAPDFKQFDLNLSKTFDIFGQALTLRADVLNVFNTSNYGGFDDWGGGPAPAGQGNWLGGDNLNVGKPNSIRGDTRTYRLALSYRF